MAAASSSTPPLGKYLSSTEKATRDKAIQSLAVFLSEPANARMSPGDMAKLWKGIFYCFWMSDKPLVQQALASELAGLLLAIDSTDAALGFLKGFWACMVREWSGIDRLRMDKYYMLIRRYVNASFQLLARAGWEVADVEAYNDILTRQGGPLCPTDPRVPPSLAYHLCDIYLAELEKVLASASSSEEEEEEDEDRNHAPLPALLSPFVSLAARTPTKATVQRVQDSVLAPLLSAIASSLSPSSPAQSDEDEEDGRRAKRRRVEDDEYGDIARGSCTGAGGGAESTGARALHGSVMKLVWDTATKDGARDANRRRLYAFWKQNGLDDESM